MDGWLDEITRQVRSVLDSFWEEAKTQGLLPMLRPVAPFNDSPLLVPVITVTGLVSLMLLSGLAVTAFGTLLVALLGLYLLLVQVFGISIELHPFGAAR